ncbi:MAG: alpha/beta hydrolase [Burkholderiaceae bacterium]|jgi:pimeloyl-ACP methyl ester carboxylesterase|nr:alpha/beta hydrolase [Burkholderiaceae bacterium]
MHSEKKIIWVSGGYRVHCEFFPCPSPRGTVLMVNGAFATITSLHHTIKYLIEQFNVVAFDLPFAGESRVLNPKAAVLEKDKEVAILLDLINIYEPDFAISMSWGGVALLLSLSQRPSSIKRAVLGSFAPEVNPLMRNYLEQSLRFLAADNHEGAAALFNQTLGRYLPRLFQRFNERYLLQFGTHAIDQILFHIRHVLSMDLSKYQNVVTEIDLPLMFVNGERDQFTPADSITHLQLPRAEIRREIVPEAGHFLDMEGKVPWRHMRSLLINYLLEGANVTPEYT